MADDDNVLSTPAVDAEVADTVSRAIGSPVPPSDVSAMTKIYHVTKGESPWMFKIDALSAVARHPDEWSSTPWPAARKSKN